MEQFETSSWDTSRGTGTSSLRPQVSQLPEPWRIGWTGLTILSITKGRRTRHRYRPTARTETYSRPGALPDVHPGTLEDDLRRRDFTINAMAVSLEGDLIDPVGGATDVSLRQLRMVAPDCFTADSVRLIRAVRLSAQFGMTITEETRSRIVVEAPTIAATAAERVRAELVALLALTTASEGLGLLVDLGIVQHMVPELVTPTPSGPVVDKTSLAAVEVLAALDAYLANNGHEGSAVAAPLISAVDALSDGAREGLRAYLSCNVGAEVTRDVLIRWAALYARKGASRSGTGEGLCSQIAHRMAELRFSNSAIEFATALMRSQQTFARVAATGTLSETGTVLDVEAHGGSSIGSSSARGWRWSSRTGAGPGFGHSSATLP